MINKLVEKIKKTGYVLKNKMEKLLNVVLSSVN